MEHEGRLPPEPERPPLGQRLYDNWALLLVAGILVMAVFFTFWGIFEVTSLEPAPLP